MSILKLFLDNVKFRYLTWRNRELMLQELLDLERQRAR